VGEDWAYRHRARDAVTCVEVTKVGTARPPRVKVRFLDDVFEGREEWVPPSRLKVLWAEVDAWLAREARWDAVSAPSDGVDDTAEFWAAETVFEVVSDEDVLSMGYGGLAGVLCVSNPSRAAEHLEIEPSAFLADDRAFVDNDGTIVVPWNTTVALARSAAPKHADAILREVTERERKAAHNAVYGEVLGSRRAKPWYVSPEVCAKVDARWVPTYELLRRWCGQGAASRIDELGAVRSEALRLAQVVERAVSALRDAGFSKVAASLERDLGVEVETLRASRSKRPG
jgi:hypothetical protein